MRGGRGGRRGSRAPGRGEPSGRPVGAEGRLPIGQRLVSTLPRWWPLEKRGGLPRQP